MSYFRQLQELEDQGIDLIEVLGQDKHIESPEALQTIIAQLSQTGDNLYSELLYYLTYRRFNSEQAETIWRAIMKHKARMAEDLGRRVSFRVAALDYLSTRTGILKQARLIAKPEFESFLSFVNIDEVTGVYNRRCFNETLGQEVRRARRYSSEVSLLLVDIDDFKRVNDRYGHLNGDAALRRVGRMLRDSTRQTDFVCRFGGDELAIILPETTSSHAALLAERIRRSIVRVGVEPGSAASQENGMVLTYSIGGATYPGDCDEAEELVAIADQMCLDAKRHGKNQVRMRAVGQGAEPLGGDGGGFPPESTSFPPEGRTPEDPLGRA